MEDSKNIGVLEIYLVLDQEYKKIDFASQVSLKDMVSSQQVFKNK